MDKMQPYLERLKTVNEQASVILRSRLQNFHFKLDAEMLSFILINGFFLTFFLFIQLFFYFLWNYSSDIGWFSFLSAAAVFYVFLKPTDDEKLTVTGFFSNFDRQHQIKPTRIFKPTSEKELVDIVKQANVNGFKIRVYGSGTAWNTIGLSTSMIVMDLYKKILDINSDQKTVRVQAGIRLGELSVALWENGLVIPNVGWMDFQTVGSAVQLSSHASSLQYGNLSTRVIALDIIDGTGEVRHITAQDKDLFDAARNGLGLLGVVSTVTFQCESAFYLQKVTQVVTTEEAVSELAGKTTSNQYYSFWWIPHINKANLFIMNKTDKVPTSSGTGTPENAAAKFKKQAIEIATNFAHRLFGKVVIGITAFVEILTPTFLGFFASSLQRTDTIKRSYEALFENFATTFPRWSETEYFVPVENATSVLKAIQAAVKSGGWKLNFPTRVSFVKGDNIWLSEAFGRDCVCFEVAMYQKASKWRQFVKKLDGIMKEYRARPHWAKYHQFNKTELEELYPRWNDFQEVRRRHDPNGIFLNDYLAPIFG